MEQGRAVYYRITYDTRDAIRYGTVPYNGIGYDSVG